MLQALEGKRSFPPSARITAIVQAHPRISARVPARRNLFDQLVPCGEDFACFGRSGYTGCHNRRFGSIINCMKHQGAPVAV